MALAHTLRSLETAIQRAVTSVETGAQRDCSGREVTKVPLKLAVRDPPSAGVDPALAAAAVVAGARSYVAVGQWAAHALVTALTALGVRVDPRALA